jgi:hypothetical protein
MPSANAFMINVYAAVVHQRSAPGERRSAGAVHRAAAGRTRRHVGSSDRS